MPTIAASTAPKLLEPETLNLVAGFVLGMPSLRTNNFPQRWPWLGVTFISMGNVTLGKLFR